MKNSTMTKRDPVSNRGDTSRFVIGNGIRIIVAAALLLAATSATAGIIFVPVGGRYINPELAPVIVQRLGDDVIDIALTHTRLGGEISLDASDVPPEFAPPASGCMRLPFDQDLELEIDLAAGTVSGRAESRYYDSSSPYIALAIVSGNSTCLPLNGRACGQLVVDLELRGAVSDPNDPSIVGRLRTQLLGSLMWDATGVAHWAAISADTAIGANEGLINSILSSMEDEECGM